MTRRDEFLRTHPDFHPGILAFSEDGEELGEVQKPDQENLTIEKGRFFSRDCRLPYDAVADIRADHLIINRSREDLDESSTPNYTGLDEARRADVEGAQTEVPIYQQDIAEREQQGGDLPLGQDVDFETGQDMTPTGDEGLPAERMPAGKKAGPMPGGEPFDDEDFEIKHERRRRRR